MNKGAAVAARYLDKSEGLSRERYSHIEAGELGDIATEALEAVDGELDLLVSRVA